MIKVEFKLLIPNEVIADPSQVEKWVNTLCLDATLINERRKAKVTPANWNEKVAGPASLAYQGFVSTINPAYVTRKGRLISQVKDYQSEKLGTAYPKWSRNLDYAFADEAQKFKNNVTAKKDNWENKVKRGTLRITGDTVRGFGAGPIACYMLTGDRRAEGFFREGDDLITGTAYDVSLSGQQNQFRAALMNQLTRAGVAIINSSFSAVRFVDANNWIRDAANAFRDPAKAIGFATPDTPGNSFLGYILEDGIFKLYGRVEL